MKLLNVYWSEQRSPMFYKFIYYVHEYRVTTPYEPLGKYESNKPSCKRRGYTPIKPNEVTPT